jgi:Tfp pilus assembly protein PilX
MKTHTLSKMRHRPLARKQRGIALVTTLLLLLLLTAMSLTMVLSVGSDMLINGYYGNGRGAFYAADSGANIARQEMVNYFVNNYNPAYSATVPPFTSATVTNALGYINTKYQGPLTSVSGPSGSWPGKFTLAPNSVQIQLQPGYPTTATDANGKVDKYTYVYSYTLTSVGQSQGSEAATLSDQGTLTFVANLTSSSTKMAFSAFGTFLNAYGDCSAPFVAGTMSGPFFTNGQWNFGDANALGSSTKYDFTDTVGQAGGNVSYWHGGNCDDNASPTDTANGSTIAPTFQGGLQLAQQPHSLPTDSFSQEQAVLDGIGNSGAAPTNATLHGALKNAAGTAYPNTGASSGVYLPYSVDPNTGAKVFTGGGIYVEGDAAITLSPTGSSGQVYTIVQNGVTTTVVTNPTATGAGTTTIQVGNGAVTTINGVPELKDPSTGSVTENATMLYVDGNITTLSGPGEGASKPAINNGVALTITAANNVTITGDIRYTTEPVTTSGSTPDVLIPANNTGQVLGIFTAMGDIQMNNQQSDGNLWIDASIAMISTTSSGGWINVGPHINNLNLVGGRIAMQAKSGNTTTRNIFFDQRFAGGAFAPPWFPSTNVTTNGNNTNNPPIATPLRISWNYLTASK